MILKHSFPELKAEFIPSLEFTLKEEFGYPKLPVDYLHFLMKNNGGHISPGYIDDEEEIEHTHEINFDTPLKWAKMNDKPVTPSIQQFFGVWLKEYMNQDDLQETGLFELVLSNLHSKEEFDILPDRMMSFAKCDHPTSGNLLAISLDEADYGSIYYYYDMWHYPQDFMGKIYRERHTQTEATIQQMAKTVKMSQQAFNEFIANERKKVPFIKVADSFTEFLEACREEAVEY